jgi:hypothetical protein
MVMNSHALPPAHTGHTDADAACTQAQELYNQKLVKGEMPLPSMLHSWHPITFAGRCVVPFFDIVLVHFLLMVPVV